MVSREARLGCEGGAGGGGGVGDNFTNLPNIPPPRPPHRQFIIYGTFGRDLGALEGDLQANYFISGAVGTKPKNQYGAAGG